MGAFLGPIGPLHLTRVRTVSFRGGTMTKTQSYINTMKTKALQMSIHVKIYLYILIKLQFHCYVMFLSHALYSFPVKPITDIFY